MYKCVKSYKNIPFAHRQFRHNGHCRLIHGHGWNIELEFTSMSLDELGFVHDFGNLKNIKKWIDDNLDHALVLDKEDPIRDLVSDYAKVTIISPPSCEGIAEHLYHVFNNLIALDNACLSKITVKENENCYGVYIPPL